MSTTPDTSVPVKADSRRAPRNSRVRNITIYSDVNAAVGQTARLADVSTFGLGFVQSKPALFGEEFILRLELEDGVEMPLLFRVMHCQPLGTNAFRVGAQLTRVINGNEAIEINANQNIEFGEAMVDMMVGPSMMMSSYRVPEEVAAVQDDEEMTWAILVDSEEYAELVAICEERDALRDMRRLAA